MTTTIQSWTATCEICRKPMSGRDLVEPGKELDRQHGHDNPIYTLMDDSTEHGAHASSPDVDTIQIARTTTY